MKTLAHDLLLKMICNQMAESGLTIEKIRATGNRIHSTTLLHIMQNKRSCTPMPKPPWI
jgi:hypothetical protein